MLNWPDFELYWPNFEFLLQLFAGEAIFALYLPKKKYFWPGFAAGVVCCLLLGLFYPLDYLSEIVFIVIFGLTVAVWRLCLKRSVLHCLYVCIAGYTVQHLSMNIIYIIRNFITYFRGGVDISTFWSYVVNYTIYVLMYLLLWFLFARKLKKTELEFNNRWFLIVAAFMLVFAVFLSWRFSSEDYGLGFALHAYAAICCCLSLLLLYSMILQRNLEKQVAVIERIQHEESEQYRISKELIDVINVKCHDLKHQIGKIRADVNDEALGELDRAVAMYDAVVKTGNDALDVVLTEKSMHCEREGISLSCMADGNALAFMRETDIYSMFGNLLDNAIEAVTKLTESADRFIVLSVKQNGALLSIHVENKYTGKLKMLDGVPETTKDDKVNHGYGVRSVGMIVERYGGVMKITAGEGLFMTDILFSDLPASIN